MTTTRLQKWGNSKRGVLLAASLVSSLIMLDSNIVAVSLPTVGRALGASFTEIHGNPTFLAMNFPQPTFN